MGWCIKNSRYLGNFKIYAGRLWLARPTQSIIQDVQVQTPLPFHRRSSFRWSQFGTSLAWGGYNYLFVILTSPLSKGRTLQWAHVNWSRGVTNPPLACSYRSGYPLPGGDLIDWFKLEFRKWKMVDPEPSSGWHYITWNKDSCYKEQITHPFDSPA